MTEAILKASKVWKEWIDETKVVKLFDMYRNTPDDPDAYRTFIAVVKDEETDEDTPYLITRFFEVGNRIMVSVDHTNLSAEDVFDLLLTQYSGPVK